MEKIEQFVQQNREVFDTETPPQHIWQEVEKTLPRKRIHLRILRMAAAIALVLGLGVVIGRYAAPQSESQLVLSDISQEYAELEHFYTQKINQKIDLLKTEKPDDKALSDISELEKEFEGLKKELQQTNMSDEQVIHAMIENYRTKIQILERVLNRIDYSIKNTDNEKDI